MEEGYEQVPPPSSIPSTPSNTPKILSSTRKRSVPGTLIRSVSDSFKSHLKVLSGSHRHHQSRVEEDNGQNFHDHNKPSSFRAIPEHSLSNHSSTSTIKAGGLHDINTSWRDTHSNAPTPDRSNLISSAQKIIQQQEIQEQIEMQEQQQSSAAAADAAMMDGFVPIAAGHFPDQRYGFPTIALHAQNYPAFSSIPESQTEAVFPPAGPVDPVIVPIRP